MGFSSQSIQSQQIEQEMTNIMSTLKVVSPPTGSVVKKDSETEKTTDFSIPNSLDDILINLTQLDVNIEASALVNLDGKILASAISERIDEFLISTITNTLGTISQDVIASLESGDLKFISLYATKGILFLSPIMKNLFLVLYTSSAKMGLINLARMVVKKKIEMFYAKQNLQRSPV
jgi:predicted regulator of Ras-like GTPase activity (Roadblock/LC7/MglB family)